MLYLKLSLGKDNVVCVPENPSGNVYIFVALTLSGLENWEVLWFPIRRLANWETLPPIGSCVSPSNIFIEPACHKSLVLTS